MDLDKKYSCLERNDLVFKKVVEVENDFQQTLQQFSNDIYRVVKCCCHGYITSVDVASDGVVVTGKIQISLTYYNEDSVLSYADFEEDFSKSVNVDGLSQSAFATGRIYDKYTNFRVVNQRKIDIHCAHCVTLLVYDKVSNPCLSSCDSSRLRCDRTKYSSIVNVAGNRLEYDEEFALNVANDAINRIINVVSYANVVDTKLIKDKALIKARVDFVVNYTVGDADERIETAQFDTELSKIVEIAGIDDGDILIPTINCGSIYAKAKTNGDSKALIEIYGDISIISTIVREQECELVTDGYIINHTSDCNYEKCYIASDGSSINHCDTYAVAFTFNNDIYEVKYVQISVQDYLLRDGKLLVILCADVLCIDLEGSVVSHTAQSQAEIEIGDYTDAIASVVIDGFDYTLSGSSTIDARVILKACAYAYNVREMDILTELDAADECVEYPALTVYFASENESIWNIAKSFSSDISLIKKENDLTGELLDCNKVLLIPGV